MSVLRCESCSAQIDTDTECFDGSSQCRCKACRERYWREVAADERAEALEQPEERYL